MPAREAGAAGQRQVLPEPSDLGVLRVRHDGQRLGECWNSHAFGRQSGPRPLLLCTHIAHYSNTATHFDGKLLTDNYKLCVLKSVVMVMIS